MTRHKWLRLVGMVCAIATPLTLIPSAQAERIIIQRRRSPVIIHDGHYVSRRVTVEFIARGDEWAHVFLDGRLLFSPHNTNRRRRFRLREGVYEIKFTGVDAFDVWAEGYLDVGRNDTNIIVVSFAETGSVRVSGDPYTWIPLSEWGR